MEIKYGVLVMLLVYYLLVSPHISSEAREIRDGDVYEIDYKGPETHSFLPPPNKLATTTPAYAQIAKDGGKSTADSFESSHKIETEEHPSRQLYKSKSSTSYRQP